MKSPIIKRSVVLNGHKTSVSLEQPFWVELKSIATERKVGLHRLISEIDANRQQHNLSSALRLFVLARYRPKTADIVSSPPAPWDSLSKETAP
jgi:predicted DNA-binding ribbon-helix-helix protein